GPAARGSWPRSSMSCAGARAATAWLRSAWAAVARWPWPSSASEGAYHRPTPTGDLSRRRPMHRIALVTDSASDIPPPLRDALEVTVVSLLVYFGDRSEEHTSEL